MGVRVGTDALALSAMGLDTRNGCVSRGLTGSSVGGGEVSKDPAELFNEIIQCTDALGLLGLVQQHGQIFEAGHIDGAWDKVAEIPRGGGDEGAVLQLLQAMTREKMQLLGATEISGIVHCMVVLHGSGRMGVDGELAGELQARATATAGAFEPMEVSMLIYGLSTMGITPGAVLLEAMQGHSKATAGDFKPPDITMLLHALAKLGVTPEAGLLEAMQRRAQETARDFDQLEVSMLMSALEKMGIRSKLSTRTPTRDVILF